MSYINETIINLQPMDSIQNNVSSQMKNTTTLVQILAACNSSGPSPVRGIIQIIILIFIFPLNSILLYVLLKNLKTLSPSEVLGLNFALLSIIYGFSLPLDIMISLTDRSGILLRISNVFATLSYTGCPLLLTSMCLERYVAVGLPVLFMKLAKWQYRAACSAVIWVLTCSMAVLTFIFTIGIMAVPLSIVINLLFVVMVACLLGIVSVLCKKGPGDAKAGEKNDSPMKKRALRNIVAVLVPSTVTYFPILALAPFIFILQMQGFNGSNHLLCDLLQLFAVLPNFGICIGPVFYITRITKFFCGANDEARKK